MEKRKTVLDRQVELFDKAFEEQKQKLEDAHIKARREMLSQGIKIGLDTLHY